MGARFRTLANRLRRVLAEEAGQGMTEYILLFSGGGLAFLVFIPAMLRAYNTYIHGFYLLLGLPFP